MTGFARTLSVFVGLAPCLLHAQAALTPRQVYDLCRDSVVSIEVETAKGEFTGTGFFYGNGRTVATALHVVDKAKRIMIRARGGDAWAPISVVIDPSADTALLRLGADSGRKPIVHAPSDSVGVGDPVVVIGDPLGLTASLSTGVVGALRIMKGVPLVQITAAISHGSSGGPVLDRYGRAVGIVSFMLTEGQNLNMAVSTKIAKGLVDSPDSLTMAQLETLGESKETTRSRVIEGSKESASARLGGRVGRLFDHIYAENIRWNHLWHSNLRNNDEYGIKLVAEESDRLVSACGNPDEWTAIRDDAVEAGATHQASDALAESYRSCAKVAYDLGLAAVQSKALASSRDEERRKASNETFYAQWDRQFQALRSMLSELDHVPYDRDAFQKAVSGPISAILFLDRFHGTPDVDLAGSPLILDTFSWAKSDLKRGDLVVGIAVDEPNPTFVAMKDWSAASAYYQKEYHAKKEARFLLKVLRSEGEVVIEEFAKQGESRVAGSYFAGITHPVGSVAAVVTNAEPSSGFSAGMKIVGIRGLDDPKFSSIADWEDVKSFLHDHPADRVVVSVVDVKGERSQHVVTVNRDRLE